MPRIGFVTGEYPPMEGGVGAFTRELAQAFAQQGQEIHIFTSRAARPPTAERSRRALAEPIDQGFARLYPFARTWRWPALTAVTDWVIRYDIDLVNIQYQAAAYHMRSPAINLLPWRLRGVCKTVVTFHDLRVPYLFPKVGWLRKTAVSFMARQADGIIVTNQGDYDNLMGRVRVPIRQIPIGSNIATYSPTAAEVAQARQALGLQPDDYLLAYFGFLNESKGADTLIKALAQLDGRFYLLFIGGQTGSSDATNHPFLTQLHAQIERLGLGARVHWSGFVPDREVSTLLHAADLMVLPYNDGVSLRRGTLMAVLANGRPLITTQPTIPTPELTHGQNVWLIPPANAPALVEAVHLLANNVALRQTLGANASHTAGLFSWEKIAAETAVFFHELLQK